MLMSQIVPAKLRSILQRRQQKRLLLHTVEVKVRRWLCRCWL